MIRKIAVCALLLLAPVLARAQEQVVIINTPLAVCEAGPVPGSSDLDAAKARALITEVFKTQPERGRYYLIHSVAYTGADLVVGSQSWYVYHEGWFGSRSWWSKLAEPDLEAYFERARVFGSPDVAVAYVHGGVPVATAATLTRAVSDTLEPLRSALTGAPLEKAIVAELLLARDRDSARATKTEAQLTQEIPSGDPERRKFLVTLEAENRAAGLLEEHPSLQAQVQFVDSATGRVLTRLSDRLATPENFKPLNGLAYRISITKKKPEPVQNLEAIAKIAMAQAAASRVRAATETKTLCAGGAFVVGHLPSDMKVQALVGGGDKQKELGSQTFDNERRYHFDFSFALPLKSREDLSIDVDNSTVTAKKIQKADLYAVVNLSPVPLDTKRLQAQYVPRLLYGMPVTGKPLQHHLLGLGVGVNRFQVFAGYRWDRNEVITVQSTGGADPVVVGVQSGAENPKWSRTFVWGLNIPVSTVVKALGAGK